MPAYGGGVGDRAFAFLLCFPFLVIMEFAHDLTFRGLRPLLRDAAFGFSATCAESSSLVGDARGVSKDLERAGSEALVGRVGTELSLRSFWKRLRRLACTFGVGAVGDMGEMADVGRLRSMTSPFRRLPMNLSSTIPAVLGRSSSSTVFRVVLGRPGRTGAGLLQLTIEDRLLAAECPLMVEISVSEEMVESGRMVSILSEKVTRALDGGRASSSAPFSRSEGCETDLLNLWPKANWLPSEGVLGALPVRAGAGGFMMVVRS